MSPVTHLLLGWATANAANLNRRERAMVTIAGVIPDADGFGLVAEIATRDSAHPLMWWSEYHHVLGHNIGFCLLVTAAGYALATRRTLTTSLVFLSFHLHLLGDLVGARGPDGEQWPIPYLSPFSAAWQWTWSGQWAQSRGHRSDACDDAVARVATGLFATGDALPARGQGAGRRLAPAVSSGRSKAGLTKRRRSVSVAAI
jgi:hypothetical protein